MAEPKEVHPMEDMTEEEQRSLQSMERSLLKQLEKVRKTLASGQIKRQEEEDQVAPIMLEENEMNDDNGKPETEKKELKLEAKEKGTKRKWEEEKEKTVKKAQKHNLNRFGFWDSCVNTEAKRELKELKEKEKIVKNELDTPSIEKWGIRVQKLRENEKKTKEARNVLQCLLKIRERALVISDEAQIASREIQKIIEKDGKSGDEKEAKWEEEPFSHEAEEAIGAVAQNGQSRKKRRTRIMDELHRPIDIGGMDYGTRTINGHGLSENHRRISTKLI
ncbi:hypothetical protein niasHS_008069 [Heterodera schachtii]|uniref:Uncharacterized protein n=1 Tax=Heterodera schachtii TaxID=97005 RepID=A0ABD2J9Y3_HETSC